MHLDQATVTDLLHELEAYQPDAQVRIAQQPAWPSRHRPRHGRGPVDLDDTSLADLGQGAQLGYLPEPVREPLGSSPPEQQGAHHGMHPRRPRRAGRHQRPLHPPAAW